MSKNHLSRGDYLEIFRELRRKEPLERTDKYYASVVTEVLMAVYGDNAIVGELGNELKDFVEHPYGDLSSEEKSAKNDSVLDKIIKELRKEPVSKESKYSVDNLNDPAAPKPPVGKVKISTLKRNWIGKQIKVYGEGLPEGGVEGIVYVKDNEPYVKDKERYRGRSFKLRPNQQVEKRNKGSRNTWRSNILVE